MPRPSVLRFVVLTSACACTTPSSSVREPPPPAWTTVAPARLIALHEQFATAALPALEGQEGARPQGVLEATLADGTKRRIQMSPTHKGAERVDDVINGEMYSAVDSDLDGRPDLLLFRGAKSLLRVEDANRDGHFEVVTKEETLGDGGTSVSVLRDANGDGAFDVN